jgi:serine/threonine protein kinase
MSSTPPKEALSDIQPNGKLLTDEQIATLKTMELKEGRHSKHDINLPYSIIKQDNDYFAIYKGKKHGKSLGEGAFGKVKLAQNLNSGEWIALKIEPAILEYIPVIETEIKMLAKLKRLKATAFIRKKPGKIEKYNILMEYAPGTNLYDFLMSRRDAANPLDPVLLIDIVIMTLKAIHEMHMQDILHRDIKLENIMYDPATNIVKSIDVGSARTATRTAGSLFFLSDRLEGSINYLAPECLRTLPVVYSEKTDVYALGRIILEILGLIEIITPEKDEWTHITDFNCSKEITTVFNRMLTQEYKENGKPKPMLPSLTQTDEDKFYDINMAMGNILHLGLINMLRKKSDSRVSMMQSIQFFELYRNMLLEETKKENEEMLSHTAPLSSASQRFFPGEKKEEASPKQTTEKEEKRPTNS